MTAETLTSLAPVPSRIMSAGSTHILSKPRKNVPAAPIAIRLAVVNSAEKRMFHIEETAKNSAQRANKTIPMFTRISSQVFWNRAAAAAAAHINEL